LQQRPIHSDKGGKEERQGGTSEAPKNSSPERLRPSRRTSRDFLKHGGARRSWRIEKARFYILRRWRNLNRSGGTSQPLRLEKTGGRRRLLDGIARGKAIRPRPKPQGMRRYLTSVRKTELGRQKRRWRHQRNFMRASAPPKGGGLGQQSRYALRTQDLPQAPVDIYRCRATTKKIEHDLKGGEWRLLRTRRTRLRLQKSA